MHWCFWIYCVCLFSCYGEGTIRSDAQIVVGRVGESAVLGCSLLHQEVGRPPLYVIEWVRFGFMLPIFIKFGLYSPRVDPQYLGRARIEEGASLHIDSLRSEDQGWYECRVLFLDRHHSEEDFQNGTWVHLTVNSPPSFHETPPMYVEVRVGDTLTLTCVAYGNPQPVILWKRDDVILESRDGIQINNGSLRIVGVERSNAGMYTCHASSEEGEIMHTSRVLVQGPPTIVVPPENTTVNVSQDVFLTCQAEAYPANLTYSWFLGSTNVYLLSNLQSRVRILVDGSFLLQQATPEDAGKYTCIPSNGMWKSPSASAYLTVLHPAYVTDMPPETYLPIGMRGIIRCPARANPPLLSVNWTKDGVPLELEKFPGWYLEEDGSLVVTTANDDALGTYTCTPYNSYGTAGVSSPTQVVLKDPPSFTIIPKEEYFQDVGRELIIPCAASGDPPPVISWAKLGAPGRSAAQMDANSSLVFRPLTKDEHGTWECTAANNVARISARSAVYVLGTSPHTVSKVSAQPLVSAVNVSWIPGYDGGYFQRFSVWYAPLMKSTTRGHHEWLSIPAPADASHLLVQNLQADTVYQFSVLSQNKLGSGPFSEIVSSSPLSTPPTTLPPPVPTTDPQDILSAPCSLSANETALGVLLQWAPPLRFSLPLRGYGLEGRRDEGAWELLDESIPPSQTQILVPGLVKDALYEFRLVAFAGDYISNPSNSVNISTAGMKVYPSQTEHPDVQQKPLLAGVVGGACFLSLAVILGIVAACMMNRRRARRRQKRRQQDAPMVFSQPKNASPSQNTNGSGSPDSLMRIKLQVSPYESFRRCVQLGEKSGNVGTSHRNSTSGRYTIYESNVGESLPLERISRGPDGRFVVETETRPSRGSIRGFPYVTETDLYPEFNARDSSDLSLCSQAKSYLQVSQLPDRASDPWREEVKIRPKATGQARKEARDSGYRQGKYFGCSSSPLDEAKPFRIPDISPVTSSVTLPYGKVEEARCGDPTHTKGELERTISTLRGSENDIYSALGGEVEAPSSLLQKPLGVIDQESQMRHSLSTQSGILQYLSLPFFKEMSVDGEWLAEDEQARTSESGSSGGTEQEATNALSMEDRTLMDVDGTSGARKEEIPCVPHTLFSLDYTNSKEQSVPVKSFLKPPEPNLGPTKAVLPGSLLWTHPPENTERLKVGQRAPWGLGEVPMDSRAEQPLSSHCKCPLTDQPFSVFTDFKVLEKQRPPVDRSLFLHGSEKVMRSSLTSQSSGRGSVSFLRPPSLAQSVGGSYLNSPFGETSSWHSGGGSQGSSAEDYRHRKDSPLATISNRRNTSVDENYEWDSDFNLEADLMDSLQVFGSSNSGPPISTIATGDVERQSMKLPLETGLSPAGSGSTDPMDCRHLQALSSPEERCAALKEEFMEYQRRRRAELKGHTRSKHYAGCYEQATLL